MRPLCFVLIPAGRRPDSSGASVDFDAVYRELIAPTVDEAGLEPLRAGREIGEGTISEPAWERLILCEFAVVDITTSNGEVFYGLGLRQGLRPYNAVLLAAGDEPLSLDSTGNGCLRYSVDGDGFPLDTDRTRKALRDRIEAARDTGTDTLVFQLADGLGGPDIARLRTDVFRERVRYDPEMKARLAAARHQGLDALRAIEDELAQTASADTAVVIDLLLSYRALGSQPGWEAMLEMVERLSAPLADAMMVREQLAFALNRLGRRQEAEGVLTDLLRRRGANSETCSILGRVYKDWWSDETARGDEGAARSFLQRAIDTYVGAFQSDWRDAFPGINAVTLMEIQDPPDPRRQDLMPVVRYAAERRIASGSPDYWDHATLIELAVLARDRQAADESLDRALAAVREPWEPQSTADNLAMIRAARQRRGEADDWAEAIEDALRRG
jgi:tetratricopeptide (TPR) repeat protein